MIYKFATLDPRGNKDAEAKNAQLLGPNTLGVEVTVPNLAQRCGLGNIDPQHGAYKSDAAAIDVAAGVELPHDGSLLVTIKPDLDSIGAMALMELRRSGVSFSSELGADVVRRLKLISVADRFDSGEWPGPRPLPSSKEPWPSGHTVASSTRELAAMAAVVADFKLPLELRVQRMMDWIVSGQEPAEYRELVETQRRDMITALEDGDIRISVNPDGGVACVRSSHRGAIQIGFCRSPVVLCENKKFSDNGQPPYRKLTLAQFSDGYVDFQGVKEDLNKLEPGWGGSSNIIGSPIGASSKLPNSTIGLIIAKHMRCENGLTLAIAEKNMETAIAKAIGGHCQAFSVPLERIVEIAKAAGYEVFPAWETSITDGRGRRVVTKLAYGNSAPQLEEDELALMRPTGRWPFPKRSPFRVSEPKRNGGVFLVSSKEDPIYVPARGCRITWNVLRWPESIIERGGIACEGSIDDLKAPYLPTDPEDRFAEPYDTFASHIGQEDFIRGESLKTIVALGTNNFSRHLLKTLGADPQTLPCDLKFAVLPVPAWAKAYGGPWTYDETNDAPYVVSTRHLLASDAKILAQDFAKRCRNLATDALSY